MSRKNVTVLYFLASSVILLNIKTINCCPQARLKVTIKHLILTALWRTALSFLCFSGNKLLLSNNQQTCGSKTHKHSCIFLTNYFPFSLTKCYPQKLSYIVFLICTSILSSVQKCLFFFFFLNRSVIRLYILSQSVIYPRTNYLSQKI